MCMYALNYTVSQYFLITCKTQLPVSIAMWLQQSILGWNILSLPSPIIHLTEEDVDTICKSPYKGHEAVFVERYKEPLFSPL